MANIKEALSSFMDNELALEHQAEIVKKISEEKELRYTWARYHLIRDTLHKNLPQYPLYACHPKETRHDN